MESTLTILIIDFVLLTASVLFLPNVKLGKIKAATYPLVALLGAAVLIAAEKAPIGDVLSGLVTNDHINPLKILILFFSMTFLSIYLDEAGFFKMLATRAANRAKANQKTLFIIIYFLTAVLTVFTSNDIVILTLTPFICFFCKNTDVDPIPYLVGEFAAGTLTVLHPERIILMSAMLLCALAAVVFIGGGKNQVAPIYNRTE